MHSQRIIFWILCLVILLPIGSCNKTDFLEARPDSDLFIPSTLEDCQALLDNEIVMSSTPVLGELSADNFYLPFEFWNTLNTKERNAYVWQSNTFEGLNGNISDWNEPYKQVFYANVILESLPTIEMNTGNEAKWKAIKGAALFARAHAFHQVAQVFAPVYSSTDAHTKMGIPIRLTPGVDEKSVRSNLQETYGRITSDLHEASGLLPAAIPFNNRNRSSRPATFALLARVYLSMDNYGLAKAYADSCLQLHNVLIKYDTLNASINSPFNKFNVETIYQSKFTNTNVLRALAVRDCIVDSALYDSYATHDLRRVIFFRPHSSTGKIIPKASYSGSNQLFTGLATDEVYLVRAECLARLGHIQEAMKDLNHLLYNRWEEGYFIPLTAQTQEEALQIILGERRKELPFRGLRWNDLRRLSKSADRLTLRRDKLDKPYILPSGDLRFTLLFPPDVINLSGMPQNPR